MRIQICLFIVLLFLFSSFALGQNKSNNSDVNFTEIKQTNKFDEFGNISEKEFSSKLKEFFKVLRKSNSLQAYVIFYNSFNSTPFQQTKFFAQGKSKTYFKYLTCICFDSPRITFIYGGLREKMTTELWLVPVNGELPKVTNSLDYAKDERYRLETLGTERIDFNEAKLNKEVVDVEDSDENESEFQRISNAKDFGKELVEVLSKDKTWRAVLIFYADKDEYNIQKSSQIIEGLLQPYVKSANLNLNRVKIVFGGYRTNPEIESWIVNKNGIEPEPNRMKKLKKKIECLI